jgi:hypothetical protein
MYITIFFFDSFVTWIRIFIDFFGLFVCFLSVKVNIMELTKIHDAYVLKLSLSFFFVTWIRSIVVDFFIISFVSLNASHFLTWLKETHLIDVLNYYFSSIVATSIVKFATRYCLSIILILLQLIHAKCGYLWNVHVCVCVCVCVCVFLKLIDILTGFCWWFLKIDFVLYFCWMWNQTNQLKYV